MPNFRDLLYYALPVLAALYVGWKISPKFNNDFAHGRVNVVFLLIMVAVTALIFVLNAFIWASVAFIAIRG